MESEVLIVLHYLFFNFIVKFLKLCHELHSYFFHFFQLLSKYLLNATQSWFLHSLLKKKKFTIEICVSEIHRCTSRPQKRICLVLYRIRGKHLMGYLYLTRYTISLKMLIAINSWWLRW